MFLAPGADEVDQLLIDNPSQVQRHDTVETVDFLASSTPGDASVLGASARIAPALGFVAWSGDEEPLPQASGPTYSSGQDARSKNYDFFSTTTSGGDGDEHPLPPHAITHAAAVDFLLQSPSDGSALRADEAGGYTFTSPKAAEYSFAGASTQLNDATPLVVDDSAAAVDDNGVPSADTFAAPLYYRGYSNGTASSLDAGRAPLSFSHDSDDDDLK